jgi:cytochrome c-type biogenesis protein CcmF
MVVHIGVVVIAVAFAASSSYGHRREFRLDEGESARLSGHTVTYLGAGEVTYPNRKAVVARVQIDGGRVYRPALNKFPFANQAIGTPSVRTNGIDDVYLTLVAPPREAGGQAVIGVIVQPLVMWLWVGGGIMAFGTLLAAVPGRRRRPTLPASAPAAVDEPEEPELAGV